MKTLLNVIWLVLCGFWLFLGYALAGVICCILIVTIPWGIASFRIANYVLWPFGLQVVQKPTAGAFSFLGNVIWFIFAGLWLAIGLTVDIGMLAYFMFQRTATQVMNAISANQALFAYRQVKPADTVLVRGKEAGKQYSVRLKDLLKRGDISANVQVRPGDIVIVPQSWF